MSAAEPAGERGRADRAVRTAVVVALLSIGVWLAASAEPGSEGDGVPAGEEEAGPQAAEEGADGDDAESQDEAAAPSEDVPGAALAGRHEWPHLSLLLADDDGLTRIDPPGGARTRSAIDEFAGGDPPFRLTRRGEAVAFHGRGGNTYALHPAAPGETWRLGRSSYHLPAADPERVWLVDGDMAADSANRVREVAIDGEVTVDWLETPSGTIPLAAVSSGLVLLDGQRLRAWDHRTGEDVALLEGSEVIDADGDRLAWCEAGCETLRVTDFAEGWEAQIPASTSFEGSAGWHSGRGALSPGGDRLAVQAAAGEGAGLTDAVLVIDLRDGEPEIVSAVQSGAAVDGRPIWSPSGQWLLVPSDDGAMLTYDARADEWRRTGTDLPGFHGMVAISASPPALGGFGGDQPLGPRLVSGLVLTSAGAASGRIRAVDPATGTVEWRRDVGEEASLGPAEDGDILVAATDEVVALDARTGSRRWGVTLEEGQGVGAPAVSGGAIYLPVGYSGEGDTRAPRLRAVDADSGAVVWETELAEGADPQWAPPVVTEDQVLVAVTPSHPGSGADNRLHALDRDTGRRRWSFGLGSEQQGFHDVEPLVDGGRVFAVSPGGGLFGIDARSGEELWRRSFVGLPRTESVTDGRLEVRAEGEALELDPLTGDRLD